MPFRDTNPSGNCPDAFGNFDPIGCRLLGSYGSFIEMPTRTASAPQMGFGDQLKNLCFARGVTGAVVAAANEILLKGQPLNVATMQKAAIAGAAVSVAELAWNTKVGANGTSLGTVVGGIAGQTLADTVGPPLLTAALYPAFMQTNGRAGMEGAVYSFIAHTFVPC